MPIVACGEVVEQAGDQIVVQAQKTACNGCPGHCIRFKNSGLLTAKADFPVGSQVQVRTSTLTLTLLTLLVFGSVPVVLLVVIPFLPANSAVALVSVVLTTLVAVLVLARWLVPKYLKVAVEAVK